VRLVGKKAGCEWACGRKHFFALIFCYFFIKKKVEDLHRLFVRTHTTALEPKIEDYSKESKKVRNKTYDELKDPDELANLSKKSNVRLRVRLVSPQTRCTGCL